MQRSSETIGTIAAALAKAQAQLVNPEKSSVATIRRRGERIRTVLPLCTVIEWPRHCAQDLKPASDRDGTKHLD